MITDTRVIDSQHRSADALETSDNKNIYNMKSLQTAGSRQQIYFSLLVIV